MERGTAGMLGKEVLVPREDLVVGNELAQGIDGVAAFLEDQALQLDLDLCLLLQVWVVRVGECDANAHS